MATPASQTTAATIGKGFALVLCAGLACTVTGGAAAAAEASVLGGIIGTLAGGVAGNLATTFVEKLTSLFGGHLSRATADAPNHDLAALATNAVFQAIGAAHAAVGAGAKFSNAIGRIHAAGPGQVAATLANVPNNAMDEADILAIIGTPEGGNSTPTKTPAFWLWVAGDLAKKTSAHRIKPGADASPLHAVKSIFTITPRPEDPDPNADAAIAWLADYLHRRVANQVNDILRSPTEIGRRARIAAEFMYLRAILEAVRSQGQNVTLAPAQLDAIKAAVAERCEALAKEPAWFTTANAALALSLREHAEASASGLSALGADVSAIRVSLASINDKLDALSRQIAEGFAMMKERLDRLGSGQLSAATLKTLGNLAAAKIAPNQFFTGREDELARLHTALAGGSVAIVHALTGEGGIGKTELAKVYALVFADTYDSVWWIDASSAALRGELVKVYERALGKAALQNAQVADLCQALVEHWKGTRPLVILDNVDEGGNFTLFSALPSARILATTRQHHKTMPGVAPFALGVLPIVDAVSLMRKEIAQHRADVTEADLTAIATELGGHALAVALAGAYLANYAAFSAGEVLAKLRESKSGDVDEPDADGNHDIPGIAYRKSVAASLSLSFAHPKVGPALPLLAAAAFLHPTGITLEWLMAGTGWDKAKASRAASVLDTFSIVKSAAPTATTQATYSVHRLTQGVARARADVAGGEQVQATLTRLLDALIDLFRWPATQAEQLLDHAKTPARLAALAHAEAVIVHAGASVRDAGEGAAAPLPRTPTPAMQALAARLRAEMAHRLASVGQLADAARHIGASIDWGEAQSPRDERGLAIWYASRASIRRDRGDLAGAEKDIRASNAWFKKQVPQSGYDLALGYAREARIRRDMGQHAEALRLIDCCLTWAKAQQPIDDWSIAAWRGDRATILAEMNRVPEAIADIAACIAWHRQHLPENRHLMARFLRDQARILAQAGDWAGAAAAIAESLPLHEAVFGPDHEWTRKARVWRDAIGRREIPARWIDTAA